MSISQDQASARTTPSDEGNAPQHSIIRCVILGDRNVGKSSLVYSYANNLFPNDFHVFRKFKVSVTIGGENGHINLELFDTHCVDDLKRVHQSNDPTNIFIVCFSVTDRPSFANAGRTWVTELRKLDPQAPFILVATKVDERSNRSLGGEFGSLVHRKEGEKLARELGAVRYIETSAFKRVNISKMFRKVISITQNPRSRQESKRKCCVL